MVTGKVVRFDEIRGYGFVAPDTGGEDVFMHVNDLEVDKRLIGPGVVVEFQVEEGDRGLKASGVRVLENASPPLPVTVRSAEARQVHPDDEELCDVLSAKEFTQEVTEVLLGATTTMTADQILQVRRSIVRLAHSHGWIEA
nr:cold shock domain-containing protein [Amycolatopsis anabasis]